jgi:hypothetical protein
MEKNGTISVVDSFVNLREFDRMADALISRFSPGFKLAFTSYYRQCKLCQSVFHQLVQEPTRFRWQGEISLDRLYLLGKQALKVADSKGSDCTQGQFSRPIDKRLRQRTFGVI